MIETTNYAIQSVNFTFNFALWRGAGPNFVKQGVQSFSRSGAGGTGFQRTGTRGQPFVSELVAYFPDFITAENRRINYHDAIGSNAFVKWEGIFLATLNHIYFVMDVDTVRIQSIPRINGPSYGYVFGTELVTRWTLLPIWTVP